jgi:CRISPR-associated protein Cmr4
LKNYLLYLYVESPLHAGGAEAEGSVNLPIQREAATSYPVVWGQSLKGALRQAARDESWDESLVNRLFGKMAGGDGDPGVNTSAGLLSVGDAQLLALPVPTLRNTFAWVTSPMALNRLTRKHRYARTGRELPQVPEVNGIEGVCATTEWQEEGQVMGPCLVRVKPTQEQQSSVSSWAGLIAEEGIGDEPHMAVPAKKFRDDLFVVGSDVMSQLVRECTEHSVRVQLDPKTKTVKAGPFTSEYLPTETVLVSALALRETGDDHQHHREQLMALLHGAVHQIGGDETLGKGLVWTRLVEETDE